MTGTTTNHNRGAAAAAPLERGELTMRRTVKTKTGEYAIETPEWLWTKTLETWKADNRLPYPLPMDSRIFTHPEEYGAVLIEGNL